MFNKANIKYLGIVFIALMAVFLVTIPGNKKGNRSFDSELSKFETADARLISIFPKNSGEVITIEKREGKWLVSDREGTFNADETQVNRMLTTLSELKAKRLASRDKDEWNTYEVTDSLGVRVEVSGEKKALCNVYFGKFSYRQPPPSGNPYMQQRQGTMTTFVRLAGHKDVFAVDGFHSMTFNRQAAEFRDRTIAQFNSNDVRRFNINMPGEQFELVKQDNDWMVNGIIADSASVAQYISSINRLSSSDFVSAEEVSGGLPTNELTITIENRAEDINIKAFHVDAAFIGMTSSQNEGAYFNVADSDIYGSLFKPQSYFLSPPSD